MHRVKGIRTRKPLNQCSPGHQSFMKRLIATARRDVLRNIPQGNIPILNNENPILNNEHIENDVIRRNNSVEDFQDENVFPALDEVYVPHNELPNSDSDTRSEHSDQSSDTASILLVYDELNDVKSLEADLAVAFKGSNMSHQQCSAVLRVLRLHPCFSTLHVDPRMILGTPARSSPLVKIAGGEYLHLGFANGLHSILELTPTELIPDVLHIDFHTDEASLDKASKILLWPIQIRIANIHRSAPEVVGIFKGTKKPTSAEQFLERFVDEVLLTLENGGVEFCGIKIPIWLRCFIGDAPARAFVLGHFGHTSRYPCSRCKVLGEYIRRGVMVFRGINHEARTDAEYSLRTDGEHHKEGRCPIGRLPMDFAVQTVFEYMHLTCIGVMEKILQATIDGKYKKEAKIPSPNKTMLTERLKQVKQYCPRDFARSPEDIEKHGKFKATEDRQICNYTGPAIFKGLVNDTVYEHFLLLQTAMRILTNPSSSKELIDGAETCIEIFVLNAEAVYGIEFLSYNIHCLLHLADDVRMYGPLDSYSAFPYENNMTYFRKTCREPNQHLQRIANRRAEGCGIKSVNIADNSSKFKKQHCNGPVHPEIGFLNFQQFSQLEHGQLFLSIYQQDNTVTVNSSSICVIQNIIRFNDGQCYLIVKRFENVLDSFESLCSSSSVGEFLCSSLSMQTSLIDLNSVTSKCFRMPYWPDVPTKFSLEGHYVVSEIVSSHSSAI